MGVTEWRRHKFLQRIDPTRSMNLPNIFREQIMKLVIALDVSIHVGVTFWGYDEHVPPKRCILYRPASKKLNPRVHFTT